MSSLESSHGDISGAHRRKIVGVMGSGSSSHASLAQPVGRLVATLGFHLLTGGGGGVMAAVSEAFAAVPERAGLVLGVVKARRLAELVNGRRKYEPVPPNPWVEVPIFTHLPLSASSGKDPLSRNHINVLTADALVVLPGGAGTRSEIELAFEYDRPLILFLGEETVDGLGAEDLLPAGRSRVVHTRDLDGLEQQLRDLLV